MPGKSLLKYFLLLFFITVLTFLGCSITKPVLNKFEPKYDTLKKKVLVMPLLNQEMSETEITPKTNKMFVSLLTKSPNLLVHKPREDTAQPQEIGSVDFGIITPPEFIDMAEELGMSALITGFINPVRTTTDRSGIWPFRRLYKYYEISITINVIDVTTRCMYLTNMETESVRISVERLQNLDEESFKERAVTEAIPKALERQVATITETLARKPWSGKILEVNDQGMKISAGETIGAEVGQVFAVFSKGDTVVSGKGRQLRLLGEKAGEVQITEVMKDFSFAKSLGEETFSSGQIIRPVHE